MHSSSEKNQISPPKFPFPWFWAAILAFITLLTIIFFYALPIRDGDIFFHLLYAKYFLKHQTLIPNHTIYSWTPATNDHIYCAWLSELFFLLLYKVGEFKALIVFRYFGVFFFVFAIWRYAKQVKVDLHPLTWLICLLGVIMSHAAIFAKPEIFSYIFMTLLVWNWHLIRTYSQEALWKNCYLFPLIMLIWVNSHGGFVFGAIFLLLVGLGEYLNGWLFPWTALNPFMRKHLFFSLLVSAIAIFITPYGHHYPTQLLSEFIAAAMPALPVDETRNNIGAWLSTFSLSKHTLSFANLGNIAIFFLLTLFLLNVRSKKIDWTILLANFVFVFLYTKFSRTTYYWVPIFAFSFIYLLSVTPNLSKPAKYSYTLFTGISTVLLSLYLAIQSLPDTKCYPKLSTWMSFGISEMNPLEAADFIKINYPGAKIGNTYGQGAYLMWTLYPENKISYDARHFPYQEWAKDYFDFQDGQNVKEFLQKHQANIWCIALKYQNLINWFLNSPEWHPVFAGRTAIVFAFQDRHPTQRQDILYSKSILEPSNAESALHTFTFLVNMREWQKASKLLEYIGKNFTCSAAHKEMHEILQDYLTGVLAYHNKEYDIAIQHLAKSNGEMINCSTMLAFSFLHLASENWEKGLTRNAFILIDKAWYHAPGNIYSLYNSGIILWYLDKINKTQGMKNAKTRNLPDWRELFHAFLEVAPKNKRYEQSISIAEVILKGNFSAENRLQLLVPPEPEIISHTPPPSPKEVPPTKHSFAN